VKVDKCTGRLSCLVLIGLVIGLLGLAGYPDSVVGSSESQTSAAALSDSRCLTSPDSQQQCPLGSPTISAVSEGSATTFATTPNGTVYQNGQALPNELSPAAPIVGIAQLTGLGTNGQYWLVGRDGGVFALDGAPFYGSMAGNELNAPIVGILPTPTGHGYWLVAADGGVFAFGDASFLGSMGDHPLNAPIVGMAIGGNDVGYYLVGADGGVFAFGGAPFYGSMAGRALNGGVVGISSTSSLTSSAGTIAGSGYFLAGSDGGIFAFGNAPFSESFVGVGPAPVIEVITISGDCDPFGPPLWEPDVVTSDGTVYGPTEGVC
jgi:hypothetical protein